MRPRASDIVRRLTEVVEHTARALGGSATIEVKAISPATVNDERVAQVVRETAIDVLGAEHVTADQFTMTAEDMSEFLSRVPGCFFFIGSANAEKGLNAPHHNPRFDIDEDVLPLGVAVLAEAALTLSQWRMMTVEQKLQELKTRLLEVNDLNSANALLSWDQTTYMPSGGAAARGRQMATLAPSGAREVHRSGDGQTAR